MKDYWTCPDCGNNLDFGEKCECQENTEEETSNENDIKKATYPELQRV